jgi:hypothetical protein
MTYQPLPPPLRDPLPFADVPRPEVVIWFKIYCGALCVLYLGVAALSLVYFMIDPATLELSHLEAQMTGTVLLVAGLVCYGACMIPFVFQPRPWLWVYDLVVICVGMTSFCCMPVCIPLLIFWIKPEVRAYFGRTSG